MMNYYRNLYRNRDWFKTKPMTPDTAPPGLFIFGQNDIYISPEIVDITMEMVPNLTPKILPNLGHFGNQENPELFNQTVREFLQGY